MLTSIYAYIGRWHTCVCLNTVLHFAACVAFCATAMVRAHGECCHTFGLLCQPYCSCMRHISQKSHESQTCMTRKWRGGKAERGFVIEHGEAPRFGRGSARPFTVRCIEQKTDECGMPLMYSVKLCAYLEFIFGRGRLVSCRGLWRYVRDQIHCTSTRVQTICTHPHGCVAIASILWRNWRTEADAPAGLAEKLEDLWAASDNKSRTIPVICFAYA